jgi:hypothetical protein
LIVKFCKAPVTDAGTIFRIEKELNAAMGLIKSPPSVDPTSSFFVWNSAMRRLFPIPHNISSEFLQTNLAGVPKLVQRLTSLFTVGSQGRRSISEGRSWKEKKEEAATRRVGEAASVKSSD